MRCKQCGEYIPEGLGIEQCICGAELPKEASKVENENELPTNESKAVEQKVRETTELLTQRQEAQINDHIDRITSGIIKKNLIWVILTIIAFLRFAIRENTALVTMILVICFVVMALSLIAIFIYSMQQKISPLKKDLKEKKVIILSAKVSSVEELKGGGKKGYEYEIYLEKNEVNIETVHFFSDNSSEIKKGDFVKLTLTPNAHFVLSAEFDVKSSFKQRRYDRQYE